MQGDGFTLYEISLDQEGRLHYEEGATLAFGDLPFTIQRAPADDG